MIVTSGCDRRVHRCAPPTSKPAESLVSQSDSAEIRALLNLTDPVERHRANETGTRVWDVSDDYVGAYPEYILPPFLHPNPSRFSDGTFGVLYAGLDFDTAVRGSAHWLAVVYAHANAPAGLRPRKVYLTFRRGSSMRAKLAARRSRTQFTAPTTTRRRDGLGKRFMTDSMKGSGTTAFDRVEANASLRSSRESSANRRFSMRLNSNGMDEASLTLSGFQIFDRRTEPALPL